MHIPLLLVVVERHTDYLQITMYLLQTELHQQYQVQISPLLLPMVAVVVPSMPVQVVLADLVVAVDILVILAEPAINKLGQATIFHHLYNLKEIMVVLEVLLERQIMAAAVVAALVVLAQMEHPPQVVLVV
tara:strand:- start:84 stop:476 length:393 start_codon:yes stop_codon:yes gene_type:complete